MVFSSRRKMEREVRSECVAVEHSKPVRHPLGMTDHRESNDVWMGVTDGPIRRADLTAPTLLGPTGRPFGCARVAWPLMNER